MLHAENWNAGVIGIAAAKIAERFYRPTVLLTGSGTVVGSCRSISGVNIHAALNACERFFSRFGGHAYAAGLTMRQEDVEEFYGEFDGYFHQNETEEMFVPCAQYDFEMELGGITAQFARELNMLAPFGPGNLQPVVLSRGVRLANLERIGKEAKHLRCHATKSEQYINAVYFNAGDLFGEINDLDRADIIYTPEINTFMGRSSLQLTLKNLAGAKPADEKAWINRNGDKFIGALSNGIMYNSSRVNFALKRDDDGALLKQAMVGSALGTLALCFTPKGAERLCAFLTANGLWGKGDARLNTLAKSSCAYNAVLFAPVLDGLDIKRYARIFLFDALPSPGMAAAVKDLAPNAQIFACAPKQGELDDIIKLLPRGRERLSGLYKALMGTTGRFYNRLAMDDALCLAARCPRWEAKLAGDIFLELGFVEKGERGLFVRQNPPKRSLEESRTYFTLNSLGELNDMYLHLYEEA